VRFVNKEHPHEQAHIPRAHRPAAGIAGHLRKTNAGSVESPDQVGKRTHRGLATPSLTGYTHKSHVANELAVIPIRSLDIKP
jgi:hypothetical protein